MFVVRLISALNSMFSPIFGSKYVVAILYRIFRPVLPNGYRAYEISDGMIYLDVRESTMMLRRCLGLYEVSKRRAIEQFLQDGQTFIDIGANKGDYSLLSAKLVGSSGKVIAFEPEPTNCTWLRKSIGLNEFRSIQLFEMALSDKDGSNTLYLGKKSGWHTLKQDVRNRNKGQIPVVTRRLDSVLESIGCTKVDMMKIDVEGGELEVLKGAERTLSVNHGIILVIDLHPQLGADIAEVRAYLERCGFEFFEMDKPFCRLAELGNRPRDVLVMREGRA